MFLLAWTAPQQQKTKSAFRWQQQYSSAPANHCYCARSGMWGFTFRHVTPQHTADRKCDLRLSKVTVKSSHLTVSVAKTLFMDLNKPWSFLLVSSWSPEPPEPPDEPPYIQLLVRLAHCVPLYQRGQWLTVYTHKDTVSRQRNKTTCCHQSNNSQLCHLIWPGVSASACVCVFICVCVHVKHLVEGCYLFGDTMFPSVFCSRVHSHTLPDKSPKCKPVTPPLLSHEKKKREKKNKWNF